MTSRRRQLGLSLVELMVSITLGMMILSGVLVVFVNASAARNEVERTSRQIENGRYAAELLSEDLRLAGFYGELNPGSLAAPGALPADPCSLIPADWNSWIPVHLQGYDDAGFASANCALTNLKANTDVLVVRRARACAAGIAGCDAAANGKPYLQVALCASQVVPNYKLGLEGTETFDMQKRTCLTTALANKREYMVRIYYISTDNGAGQSIPTLKRLELTGSGWSNVPLVEGIEEMQLHYGIDHTCDGQPDVYVTNPTTFIAPPPPPPPAPPCGTTVVDNWMNVVTVQFHLLARNLETSPGYTDTKRYILGKDDAGNNIERTPGGSFRRHVYSGLVRVANAGGRRDTP